MGEVKGMEDRRKKQIKKGDLCGYFDGKPCYYTYITKRRKSDK